MITPINNPVSHIITNSQQSPHAKKINPNEATSILSNLNDPEAQKHAKVGAIQERIRMGKELSSDELNYLRENSPEIYGKAMEISARRRLLENKLKNCTSKEEVRALQMSNIGTVSNDTPLSTSAEQNDFALIQIRNANNVFDKFTQSQLFKQLPTHKNTENDKEDAPFGIQQPEDSVGAMVVSKMRSQRIAMKIARGETITSEEQSFIDKNEPGLVSEAKRAVDRRKKIALEMRYKPSNNEKKQFLQHERNNVIGFEGNGTSAELMLGAIDKLESEL